MYMLWIGTGLVSGYARYVLTLLATALAGSVGIIVGFVVSLLRDRIERKHKERTRWHDVRRESYVAFLHAADAVWKEGQTMPYEWKARLDSSDPDSRSEAWAELVRYRGELAACYREIQLVGSPVVVEAARDVNRCVNTIASAVGVSVNAPESADAHQRAEQAWTDAVIATEKFKDEARAELGIAPPSGRA